jgi:hypothetical protein
MRAGPAFSPHLDGRPWNASLRGYRLPSRGPSSLTTALVRRCCSSRTAEGGCAAGRRSDTSSSPVQQHVAPWSYVFSFLSCRSISLSEKCLRRHSHRQSPVKRPTPPHILQTDRPSLLRWILGGRGPVGGPALYSQFTSLRLPQFTCPPPATVTKHVMCDVLSLMLYDFSCSCPFHGAFQVLHLTMKHNIFLCTFCFFPFGVQAVEVSVAFVLSAARATFRCHRPHPVKGLRTCPVCSPFAS